MGCLGSDAVLALIFCVTLGQRPLSSGSQFSLHILIKGKIEQVDS